MESSDEPEQLPELQMLELDSEFWSAMQTRFMQLDRMSAAERALYTARMQKEDQRLEQLHRAEEPSEAEIEASKAKAADARGKKFFKRGRYNEAALCFEACKRWDPKSPDHDNNLAEVNLRLRKYEFAELNATRVIAVDANDTKARFRRSKARRFRGNLKGAEEDMVFVRKALPGDEAMQAEDAELQRLRALNPTRLREWVQSVPPPAPNLDERSTNKLMDELH